MIVAAFSIFTLSFTDYGVPLMVGGKYKTLPVVMYQEVIGQLDFGKGCVYGSMLLVPAIVAFLVDLANKNNANATYVTRAFDLRKSHRRDIPALCCALALSLFSMLPILSFVVLAFVKKYPSNMTLTLDNLVKTMNMGGSEYLINSLIIAALAAVIGVVLAVLAAYHTARHKGLLSRYLHLLCMSMAAIPGVVLGLAYVLFFKESSLRGTLAILVIVNVVHFFASPYLMMYTSFSKLNENLESVASTLGIGRLRLLWSVLLPMCKRTVVEMFSYFFVNCMMTISAVSFLANVRNKPIALMINQFEAQAQMECAAVVSLAILVMNLIVKIVLEYLPEKKEKNNAG
jgi:iron(III) transport system permease protein